MNPLPPFDNPDSFDSLMRDLDTLPETRPDLAESIFAQTRGVQSRRRWLRRGRLVVACLVCYAVGIGSGWLLKPGTVPQVAGHLEVKEIKLAAKPDSPVPQITDPPLTPRAAKPTPSSTPQAAKASVAQTKVSPFENFRRAGDRQLFERGNIRSAMDCYRRALTHATEQQLRVEIDSDSWLLMSLKQSRLEERKHVRQKRV